MVSGLALDGEQYKRPQRPLLYRAFSWEHLSGTSTKTPES